VANADLAATANTVSARSRSRRLPTVLAATTAAAAAVATTTAATAAAATTAAAAAIATATTAAAAAEAAATTAATRAALALLRLIDADGTTVEFGPIERGDRTRCVRIFRKRHETKAARATGLTIRDDLSLRNLAEATESSMQTLVVRAPSKAADEQLITHFLFSFSLDRVSLCPHAGQGRLLPCGG
jgi:hypothetical protein